MKKVFSIFCLIFTLQVASAQNSYMPTKENLEARQWFQEARFGLFIHWGVYSVLGDGEWVMNNKNISIEEYEKLSSFFNPTDFNPEEWVKMAKDAGMKYITITSRHHDGFSMFDSKVTDYNIVKKSPYKKDVLKMLADECRKEGIKLFFYYSLLDWHDDNYFPRGRTGTKISGRNEGDWNKYIDFMKAQLTELLTNYGDIGGIWFDGHWDQKEWDGVNFGKVKVDWHYNEIYELIHNLQPQCLIGNNHHLAPIPGEDFQMFERDLPGHNTTGWGTDTSDVGELPKEVCETINGSWGFNLQDSKHKSEKEIIQYIVRSSGYGSNLLLNVGPMPNGKIQKEHIASLKNVGVWMRENGETIYKTKAGPIAPTNDMALTQRGKTVYLHILNNKKELFFIENFYPKLKSVKFYKSDDMVTYRTNEYGMFIEVPKSKKDPIDTIIEIILK